ncbi:YceI family protein [Campylobacter sp. RM9344]|uniref:YceI family protein n=1 Tax=Campylobacter californiensis TaxID=1032243 RepID=A0AAW3ZT04_9BACT|nr:MULTISPECIES: YceI family protein [unclassified Campylobacter]MBE2984038.1 YceI family protein [Campylobacter sp. RM6883]MBE2987083.1 YceI family protein [Campylobacter sp. RM12919]MBE2988359.1 YceI family protein [Campylobacter sp. RM12920]MBE2995463.1 YceI family protein [Campylobacter sp. RM6913]MBE3030277.1 YceI family protein [Campylobacter sp. RM9344]
MKKLKFSLALALLATFANAAVYELDPIHSSTSFKIKHLSISNVVGSFKSFKATADMDGEKLKSLSATIKTDSIFTDNDARDKHLRSADFFEVEKYPEIKFEMTGISGDDIKGNLTIKNVTKPVILEYEFGGKTVGQDGKAKVGFSLEGEIKRSDFDFAPSTSTVTLGDKIKIDIEVEAVAK